MSISISIKQRIDGKWHNLKVDDLAGQTLRQVLHNINGKDAVAELVIDQEKIYFCGTKHWLERMSVKGKVATFEMLVNIIEKKKLAILDEPIPGVDLVGEVFKEFGYVGTTSNQIPGRQENP